MKYCIKLIMVLVFLLGLSTGYCNAGTYASKKNPQLSVEYENAPGVYFAVGQCKAYSRQNSGKVVSCWATLSRHFYLNGEIVDDRMEEIAKTQMAENAFIILLVLAFFGIGFYIYMIPTFTAYNRNHPQRFWIMMLNLFCGETLVGWIAALIWARGGGENENAREDRP